MIVDTTSWILSFLFVLVVTAIRIVLGLILWKWIAVGVLGLPALSFFQYIGLLILIQLLTGRGIKASVRRQYYDIKEEDNE